MFYKIVINLKVSNFEIHDFILDTFMLLYVCNTNIFTDLDGDQAQDNDDIATTDPGNADDGDKEKKKNFFKYD